MESLGWKGAVPPLSPCYTPWGEQNSCGYWNLSTSPPQSYRGGKQNFHEHLIGCNHGRGHLLGGCDETMTKEVKTLVPRVWRLGEAVYWPMASYQNVICHGPQLNKLQVRMPPYKNFWTNSLHARLQEEFLLPMHVQRAWCLEGQECLILSGQKQLGFTSPVNSIISLSSSTAFPYLSEFDFI